MDHEKGGSVLRIGELSRRVGVSEQVLRAWESRYGLLNPERSAGGYRLYSAEDQNRVRRMQVHLAGGLAAAEAAQAAIAEEQRRFIEGGAREADGVDTVPTATVPHDSADALRRALDAMDEPAAQTALDRLLMDFTVEAVLREVVMPFLEELGTRWENGAVSVAQEHFASYVVRGRLTGLARGWGNGRGPLALLACPPDEQHDLALLAFGIVLNRRGWRVEYLGANTPMVDIIQVTMQTQPSLVVLAATTPERFETVITELSELADLAPLVLAGAGARQDCARRVSAHLWTGDPVTAAEHFAPA